MTARHVVLFSIPGLRTGDLASMPNLSRRGGGGVRDTRAQLSLRDVAGPGEHANGATSRCAWRGGQRLLLASRTPRGDVDRLERNARRTASLGSAPRPRARVTSAVWFPMHSKGCGAD